jgi:hypothetical protein
MKEDTQSDLFSFLGEVSILCITTNGDIKKDGRAVMGKGVALGIKKIIPHIDICLAEHLKLYGNFPGHLLSFQGTSIFSFPVKRHWNEDASLKLIKRSALVLKALVDVLDNGEQPLSIVLPRPGCGAGNLDWNEVKLILEEVFDERFLIVSK